jgi:signal transduction histidine kinase
MQETSAWKIVQELLQQQFLGVLGNKEGSGLGLAICRSIIEAHGGSIGVAEQAAAGVCVWFMVPAQGAVSATGDEHGCNAAGD